MVRVFVVRDVRGKKVEAIQADPEEKSWRWRPRQRDAGLDVSIEIRLRFFIVIETLGEFNFESLKRRKTFSLVN